MYSSALYIFSVLLIVIIPLSVHRNCATCVPPSTNYIVELFWAFNRASGKEYRKHSVEMQNTYMPKLFNQIAKKYPGSRFGLMHFNGKKESPCWELKHSLTTTIASVTTAMQKIIMTKGGGSPEKSLGATYYLAGSLSVGWTRTQYNSIHQRVIKIIVLSGDDVSFPILNKDVEKGYAKCDFTSYTTTSQLGTRLRQQDIAFIGMISPSRLPTWESYFREMKCAGKILKLNLTNTQAVIDAIFDSVTDVICKDPVPPETTTTSTTTPTTTDTTTTLTTRESTTTPKTTETTIISTITETSTTSTTTETTTPPTTTATTIISTTTETTIISTTIATLSERSTIETTPTQSTTIATTSTDSTTTQNTPETTTKTATREPTKITITIDSTIPNTTASSSTITATATKTVATYTSTVTPVTTAISTIPASITTTTFISTYTTAATTTAAVETITTAAVTATKPATITTTPATEITTVVPKGTTTASGTTTGASTTTSPVITTTQFIPTTSSSSTNLKKGSGFLVIVVGASAGIGVLIIAVSAGVYYSRTHFSSEEAAGINFENEVSPHAYPDRDIIAQNEGADYLE